MGKLIHICLGLVLVNAALAQSAANFDTRIITPEAPAPAPKEAKAGKPASDKTTSAGATVPSRYVGEDDLEPYLTSLASVFQSGKRDKDPFGHFQDPDAKPIVKPTLARVSTQRAPARATPLSEIVELLQITTIMPGEKSFLLGTRKVKVGDELPLVFRGKQIRVEVTEVTSRLLAFRNVESSETGTRELDMLPPGMRSGNGSEEIRAPGMVPDRPNAPIELDMGDSTP